MSFVSPSDFRTRPDLRGTFGMCASTHWLATQTAQSVLERGGNAFDASTAAAFVLHVVEPHLNGPGGDLVAIVAPASGEPSVLVGQGPAPAGATIDHFRAEGLDMVPAAGALAAAVPGAVDAWLLLLRDYGTWELADVLAYAIDYAGNGHPLSERVGAVIGTVAEMFAEYWPTSAALWMPRGMPPAADVMFRNPAFAGTLERLVSESRHAPTRDTRIEAARTIWKGGFVAEGIEAFARHPHRHSSGSDHAGVITAGDMASFSAHYETPVAFEFRGHTVLKGSSWGQGPVLLQALAILDGLPDEHIDPSTAVGAHHVLESLKLAMADRDAYYGEDLSSEQLDLLLSPEYASVRRKEIGETASHEFRPGACGLDPFFPPLVEETDAPRGGSSGEPTVSVTGETRGDTCHLDIIDRWGNAVSATPSGGWLQSSPSIPELGFALGTRLQMTWLDPASPSALRPGHRPRTTLTPTMLFRGPEVVAALGTPGGDQQDQWQLSYLLRTLVGGYTPQQAIDAPTFHTTSMPSSFWPRRWTPGGAVVEDRLGEDVITGLRERGHRITRAGDWSLGRLSTVTRDPATGVLGAAANARGAQGYAVGR
ncbi:gamma-glutamyltransferase family protein [Rhodococcus opacus]|uniref:Transferase n=1 Tax=Rhodococcus opacus TaxID=37919 RepID=A0A076EQT1_RHOOP|nr:gamma-glutamyltransferase [Rhodococcus opacus]AII08291.1 transferase [Rhodococcus opacus]